MSKKIVLLILVSALFFTSSCSILEEILDFDFSGGNVDYVKSDLDFEIMETHAKESDLLSMTNVDFAVTMFQKLIADEENIIFSPFSLYLALNMTLAGAESTTEDAILQALMLKNREDVILPEESVHRTMNNHLFQIRDSEDANIGNKKADAFQLNIANSMWCQSDFEFEDEFLDTLALYYDAGVYTVDFKTDPDGSRKAVNDWVEKETEEKIKDILPPNSVDTLTRLILANALYFNGSWDTPFERYNTEKAPFYRLDGSEVSVDMMSISGESYPYYWNESYQIVTLPYISSDFSMMVIVPDQGTFEEFEENLSGEWLYEMLDEPSYRPVDLSIPKFDFDYQFNATQVLSEMGMAEAFDPMEADFSGITKEESLVITSVLHKATISVDENGTEAAAATTIMFGLGSAPPDPNEPVQLIIDRPFVFLIQHEPTGTILFMGHVLEP